MIHLTEGLLLQVVFFLLQILLLFQIIFFLLNITMKICSRKIYHCYLYLFPFPGNPLVLGLFDLHFSLSIIYSKSSSYVFLIFSHSTLDFFIHFHPSFIHFHPSFVEFRKYVFCPCQSLFFEVVVFHDLNTNLQEVHIWFSSNTNWHFLFSLIVFILFLMV